MFYETERIIRKQQKYIKSKAYATINRLENKGLDDSEISACLDVMLEDDNNETQVDILNLAKTIIVSRQENVNEEISTTDYIELTSIDGVFALHQDGGLRARAAAEKVPSSN